MRIHYRSNTRRIKLIHSKQFHLPAAATVELIVEVDGNVVASQLFESKIVHNIYFR